MIVARYETYKGLTKQLPFVLHTNLERTALLYSKEPNWHDNLEIQLCIDGEGMVLLNGVRYGFSPDDVIVVNSNTIHYTCTENRLTYACLIISTDFCEQMGIDYDQITFSPQVRNPQVTRLFRQLIQVYSDEDHPFRIAQLNNLLLELLITLGTNHTGMLNAMPKSKAFQAVREALTYIRKNYNHKITLNEISQEIMFDKFALCRAFREITGQTVFENLNQYRCLAASEYIQQGHSVSEAAAACGFENLSFFTKTFKKYMGVSPSFYKNAKNYRT